MIPKKVQRSYLSWHWRVVQNLKKNWLGKLGNCLENDMSNLADFHQHIWRCQNWYFHGILLSKVENIWAKKLQGSYVQWHWRIMKNLKRNWLWRILNWTLESFKNLYFNELILTKVYNFWAKKIQRRYIS